MAKIGLTIKQHGQVVKLLKRFYKDGVTIENALNKSLGIDFKRMREEINLVGLTGNRYGQLIFTVSASKKYLDNKYGRSKTKIAKKHFVHIEFDQQSIVVLANKVDLSTDRKIIIDSMYNIPIKYQCSCGRHTFWYRYIWTILKSSIGLQQSSFPKIRNQHLEGLFCKHGIKVATFLKTPRFQGEFIAFLKSRQENRQFRTKNPFTLNRDGELIL